MKLVASLIILHTFLFSNYIDTYRENGIEAIKKEFDRIIQTKLYWDKVLETKDIRFGYYESIDSILVCVKNNKEITLYNKQNNQFKQEFLSSVFIGEIDGDKQKEGDLKTPSGVYRLTQRLTKLDSFYGPLALVTSYPNLYDKVQKKTGHGIWIHGLPSDNKREDFTKGCMALDNEKLKELNTKFNYKKSILLLSNNQPKDITKDEMSNILSQIYQWKNSWQNNDIEEYMSFYSNKFKNLKGLNFNKFKNRKARIFKRAKNKSIDIKNINISPHINGQNKRLFKVIMYENYKTRTYKFNGKKELYIELNNAGKISIITES